MGIIRVEGVIRVDDVEIVGVDVGYVVGVGEGWLLKGWRCSGRVVVSWEIAVIMGCWVGRWVGCEWRVRVVWEWE